MLFRQRGKTVADAVELLYFVRDRTRIHGVRGSWTGFCKGVFLLLRKLSVEMTFNIFTTKRVSCFGQYDRIDDLITCKLRGDKCRVLWQFLVDELHFSAVFKCFDPLFVWHFRISSGKDPCKSRVYVVRCQKSRMGMKSRLLGAWHSNGAQRTTMANCPLPRSLPERTTPESLDAEGGERSGPSAVLLLSTQPSNGV